MAFESALKLETPIYFDYHTLVFRFDDSEFLFKQALNGDEEAI